MNAQVEADSTADYCQSMIIVDSCRPEYQHSMLSSGVGGISFSPLHLLKRTALVSSIAVIGTIPLPAPDSDLTSSGTEVSFVFPSSSDITAEDEYSRIREEIVASGLPMLSDEEVRAEIRERKGGRGGGTDS
jgi:hypothetical protein